MVWFLSFLPRSERACHPERRRREGSAFRVRGHADVPADPSLARVPRGYIDVPADPSLARVLRTRRCTSGSFARERRIRSEEHTSELQSRPHLVCRLLLEQKDPSFI